MEIELQQFQPNFFLESPGLFPLIAATVLIVFAMTAESTKRNRPRIVAALVLAPMVAISMFALELHFLRDQDERRDAHVSGQHRLIEEKISTGLGREIELSGKTLDVWLQDSSNSLDAVPMALSYEQAGDQLSLPISALRSAPGSSTFELYIEGLPAPKDAEITGELLTADSFAVLNSR